jgi:hypothetical protein
VEEYLLNIEIYSRRIFKYVFFETVAWNTEQNFIEMLLLFRKLFLPL